MTHPTGPAGPGPGGGSGTNPKCDDLAAIANADAYTSLLDIFAAAQIRRGYSPDQLDRNGRLEMTR